jgi:isopentenyl-diphosphate Delta-isomerase
MADVCEVAGVLKADLVSIPAIDGQGNLFAMDKMDVHRLGQFHLAVSVFVFCGDHLLIQQRAPGKYHCAGQWANTCCSHPHWGESLDDAAHRRLGEELGLILPLARIGGVDYRAEVSDTLVEHERVAVYRADVASMDLALSLNPTEVSATRWATRDALRAEARADPARFAPWFAIYLERWAELGL